ncbi:MAG TPA: PilZ domain-containing protein [Kofleriaceae bacterium]|nr:PilZ domain-containing protein [Kofleriaceae bacterium]
MDPTGQGTRRRVQRRTTSWVAQCRVEGRVMIGAVLDISAHGAFFCPEPDGAAELAVGQVVAIAFDGEPNLAGIDLPCRVRWVGFSSAHGRRGVGLEFTGGPIAA